MLTCANYLNAHALIVFLLAVRYHVKSDCFYPGFLDLNVAKRYLGQQEA